MMAPHAVITIGTAAANCGCSEVHEANAPWRHAQLLSHAWLRRDG